MQDSNQTAEYFKQCPLCREWFSDNEIMSASSITPIGMLIDAKIVNIAMFFFNHTHSNCGTTFAINAEELAHLIDEAVPTELNTLKESCEGHCIDLDDKRECSQDCKWVPYRRLLRTMLETRQLECSNIKEMVKRD